MQVTINTHFPTYQIMSSSSLLCILKKNIKAREFEHIFVLGLLSLPVTSSCLSAIGRQILVRTRFYKAFQTCTRTAAFSHMDKHRLQSQRGQEVHLGATNGLLFIYQNSIKCNIQILSHTQAHVKHGVAVCIQRAPCWTARIQNNAIVTHCPALDPQQKM